MRRISLDSLFTMVARFLSHSTGTLYLPGGAAGARCGGLFSVKGGLAGAWARMYACAHADVRAGF